LQKLEDATAIYSTSVETLEENNLHE